jgi:hypothetical protein
MPVREYVVLDDFGTVIVRGSLPQALNFFNNMAQDYARANYSVHMYEAMEGTWKIICRRSEGNSEVVHTWTLEENDRPVGHPGTITGERFNG